jgi:uncharacterized membrane protein
MSHSRTNSNRSKTNHCVRWNTFWPVWAVCAALISFCISGYVEVYFAERPQKSDIPVVSIGPGQDLRLDMGELSPGKLHLYEVSYKARRVQLVVQRTQDNAVHVALATCRACYRSKNPHYVRNGVMMCGKCETAMYYGSKLQRKGVNGCVLPEIPHTEGNGKVTILARDVFDQASQLLQ